MDLRNHVVVIAGAAGRIGLGVAKLVLQNGGKVAAAVRKPWQVARLQEQLGRDRVLVGLVGALDTEAAAGFAKGANDALGPVTAFVGAAGAWAERRPLREPDGQLAEQLEANLLANATLARALLPGMRRRHRGLLLFVGAAPASLAAGSTSFVAAKEAVHGYVRALALDLADTGVQAGAVLPSFAAAMAGDGIERTIAALARLLGPVTPATGALLSTVE